MAAFYKFPTFLLGFIFIVGKQVSTRVIDVGENFNELKKDGRFWFVEFYAPWCGHCKRLEPIWDEVGEKLAIESPNIVTAKIDCTKHEELAKENGIRGFPTLKFFRGKFSIRYQGSYTKEALVEFAKKSSRPILTELKTANELEQRRSIPNVFFLLVHDDTNESNKYKEIVQEIAEEKVSQVLFYTISKSLFPKDINLGSGLNLFVFKEGLHFKFEDTEGDLNESKLATWVDQEKFLPFMYISDSNIHELVETGKMVVLITFSKDKLHSSLNAILGEVGKRTAIEKFSTFGKIFQFAGIFDTDVIESIMMSPVYVPMIFVFDPESHFHYILPSSQLTESFNEEQLHAFLQDIINGKAMAHGGRTFSLRMFRIWWDVRTTVKGVSR
ncbi:protein disulfide-isomerase TMX3-like isoform X2 [Xenia sp. Carnegie-2017]|uniref:protein disulfide-isomerase TMX3-like isoform X2 n=1 Tax=Xenia sp. Carnegie-2017 TaxID=2897299 RepID=UPI001F03AAEC|nr:protein disulfide-isomerase TMX3-like isoform X2 [Xenia sp. Carnegie-2017]